MNSNGKYQSFGKYLKKIRLEAKKTIDDVSGAVELPVAQLQKIEAGEVRPHQDLVYLLASYFKLGQYKMTTMLNLAGYKEHKSSNEDIKDNFQAILEKIIGHKLGDGPQIMVAFSNEGSSNDQLAVFTNGMRFSVNNQGMIIEFLQQKNSRHKKAYKVVSRVGMSIDHAHKLKDTLQQALDKLQNDNDNPASDSANK